MRNLSCIQYDKDTILKAIYNEVRYIMLKRVLYSVWQRYNFESNLQHEANRRVIDYGCIQYDKDTILKAIYNIIYSPKRTLRAVFSMTKIQFWKQFTTSRSIWPKIPWLYSVWQRYNFESNLQQRGRKNPSSLKFEKNNVILHRNHSDYGTGYIRVSWEFRRFLQAPQTG